MQPNTEIIHEGEFKFDHSVRERARQTRQAPQVVAPVAKREGPSAGVKVTSAEDVARLIDEHNQKKSQPAAQQSKPVSERDARYFDLTLPSNFYFYSFKSLSARRVGVLEQGKFAYAAREGRLKHVVDTVSSLLGDGISAYDLSPNDFYSIMYWLRLNSASRTPFTHMTVCENPEHIAQVVAKEKKEETLRIEWPINSTMLKETQLDTSKIYIPSFADRIPLHTVKMKDVVEISEWDEDKAGELMWYADRAAFLRDGTLEQRIKLIQTLSMDDMDELQQYMDSITSYGVDEFVNVRCKECGAEKASQIVIDALSFLPVSRRKNST